jgi:hypothetical protein
MNACPIDLHGLDRNEILPPSCVKMSEQIHYVVVRKDLPSGDQLANCAHAAGESSDPKPEPGTTAVVLHAVDEQHLMIIRDRLIRSGLKHHCVIECPDDEDYPSQLMSIGLCPTTDRAAVKKVLSSLPLAK